MRPPNERLAAFVALYVRSASAWPWLTLFLCLLLVLGSAQQASKLTLHADTTDLISADLGWRQDFNALRETYPELIDRIVLVVEGPESGTTRAAASWMLERISQQAQLLMRPHAPELEDFFERNALLYMPSDEAERAVENLLAAQPLLARLKLDPSLAGFAQLLEQGIAASPLGVESNVPFLAAELRHAIEDKRYVVPWVRLIETDRADQLGKPRDVVKPGDEASTSEGERPREQAPSSSADGANSAVEPEVKNRSATPGARLSTAQQRVHILLEPKYDASALLPIDEALQALNVIREAAANEFPMVTIRMTGALVMEHDETASVAHGAGFGVLWVLLLVAIVLVLGLRAWQLVVATVLTLIAGLIVVAAFAALSVGRLNLISVAFAVLYVGLAVDYSIHFCLRFRELRAAGSAVAEALDASARDVGVSLFLCAFTTGLGFFAFVPTDYDGVSELGVIAGGGMFIGLLVTLTLLPALLKVLKLPDDVRRFASHPLGGTLTRLPVKHPQTLLTVVCFAAAAASLLVAHASFDDNPLNLRDGSTEAVQTYRDLLRDGTGSPWRLSVLSETRASARGLIAALEAMPTVASATSLDSFIPQDQQARLDALEALQLSYATFDSIEAGPAGDVLQALQELLDTLSAQAELHLEYRALRVNLEQLLKGAGGQVAADVTLESLETRVAAELPDLLRLVGSLLAAQSIDEANIPERIRQLWERDGVYRVDIEPAVNLNDPATLEQFLAEVRSVAPNATGHPVAQLEAGKVVVQSFQQAFVLAILAVVAAVYLMRRRVGDVAIVSVPLVLSFVFAVAFTVLFDQPFNFANVVALPLILGVGVDNGIHMLSRQLRAPPASGNPLETSTARAVLFSALTTCASFGNLAFSNHPGTASMGWLLSVGMVLTLCCTLIVLPSMLAVMRDSESDS